MNRQGYGIFHKNGLEVRGLVLQGSADAMRVLEGLDVETASGEFLGITDPSGCGKTTPLNAVAGLLAPSSGIIEADRGSPGHVFQRPMLLPWRTALDNAAYGLECHGMPAPQARIRAREFLEKVGLDPFAGYLPHELLEGARSHLHRPSFGVANPT